MHLNKFLKDKVIWITGASQGLGRELTIELAKYPTKLILSARSEAQLRQTQKLARLSETRCLILPLDLTLIKDSQLAMIQDRILQKFGSLDCIVHNASLSQRSLAHQTHESVERKIMETVFFGPVKLTKAMLPKLLKNQESQIVIISSLAGKFGVPLRSSYSAAKHALHGFFEAMSIELKNKIKIQFFVLGGVKTESAKHALSADGSLNNRLDSWHERNMPADQCAREIIERLPKKEGEYVIGRFEKLGLLLKKYAPCLHKKILYRFFQKELKTL